MTIFKEIKTIMEEVCTRCSKEKEIEQELTNKLIIGKMIPDVTCLDGWSADEYEWEALIKIEYPKLSKNSKAVQKIEEKIHDIFCNSDYWKIEETPDTLCYSITVILQGEC